MAISLEAEAYRKEPIGLGRHNVVGDDRDGPQELGNDVEVAGEPPNATMKKTEKEPKKS